MLLKPVRSTLSRRWLCFLLRLEVQLSINIEESCHCPMDAERACERSGCNIG